MRRIGGRRWEGRRLDELQLERLDWLKCSARGGAGVLSGGERDAVAVASEGAGGGGGRGAAGGAVAADAGARYRCWRIATPLYLRGNFNRRDGDLFGGRSALALLAIPEETDVGAMPPGRPKL